MQVIVFLNSGMALACHLVAKVVVAGVGLLQSQSQLGWAPCWAVWGAGKALGATWQAG